MALSVTGLHGLHQDITVIKRTLKKIMICCMCPRVKNNNNPKFTWRCPYNLELELINFSI